jgi:hypothetical protein
MDLVPSDSVSQTAPSAVLNQNSRRRSCGLSYIRNYAVMRQGRQYPSFLPASCSVHSSSVWLGRLENGQLSWSIGEAIGRSNEGGEGYGQQARQELSKQKSALNFEWTDIVSIDLYTLPDHGDMVARAEAQ